MPPAAKPAQAIALRTSAHAQAMVIVPADSSDLMRIAAMLHRGGLAPSSFKTAEAIASAIMAGAEIGLLPFQSLQAFAVINGRPTLWGDAVPALLRLAGFKMREWFEGEAADFPDTMTAHCEVTAPDGEITVGKFSVAQAKRAKLWEKRGSSGQDTPWITYPDRMLKMRARAFAARDGAPEVLRGIRIREEEEDTVGYTGPGPGLSGAFGEQITEAEETVDPETGEIVDAEFTEADPNDRTAGGGEAEGSTEMAGEAEVGDHAGKGAEGREDGSGGAGEAETAGETRADAPSAESALDSSASATTASEDSPDPKASGQPAPAEPTTAGASATAEEEEDPEVRAAADAIIESFAKLADWPSIRGAVIAFNKAWHGKVSNPIWRDVKSAAYIAAAPLEGTPGPTEDPAVFNVWIAQARPHEIKPIFKALCGSPAYKALNDDQREQVGKTVIAALAS